MTLSAIARTRDCQGFSEFADFLTFFEIDDEPDPGSGGHSEILLGDAQPLACVPDPGNLGDKSLALCEPKK
jgi:hypothetical protein